MRNEKRTLNMFREHFDKANIWRANFIRNNSMQSISPRAPLSPARNSCSPTATTEQTAANFADAARIVPNIFIERFLCEHLQNVRWTSEKTVDKAIKCCSCHWWRKYLSWKSLIMNYVRLKPSDLRNLSCSEGLIKNLFWFSFHIRAKIVHRLFFFIFACYKNYKILTECPRAKIKHYL